MSEEVINADPPENRPVDSVHDSGTEPQNGHGHRNLGIALALICMAQLMVVLDGTIVNIALPHIKDDLGFSNASLPWVVNAYALAFGGLLLLGGRIGDILGRRKVFVFGVVLFGLASFVGGIAQTEGCCWSAGSCKASRPRRPAPNALA
jgi:MFS family permease